MVGLILICDIAEENLMANPDLNKVHLEWCKDIFNRIKVILDDPTTSDADKIHSAAWLVKQGLKIERED